MKNLIFCFLFITFPLLLSSQKGFQFGVGFNHNIAQNNTIKYFNDNDLIISNLYGASLNIDYSFNSKFRIKSGIEYKSQNILFSSLLSFNAEYIIIPIIFNYNFLHLERSGLTLGIDAGLSLDKTIFQTASARRTLIESEIKQETITTLRLDTENFLPIKVLDFPNSVSVRFGISAIYNIGKRGQLNFFVQRIYFGHDDSVPYTVGEQIIVDGQEISNRFNRESLKISTAGLQFGLYYTFGTLTFK